MAEKRVNILNKLATTLHKETEQPGNQREHERINQKDQWWPLKMTAIVVCVFVFIVF